MHPDERQPPEPVDDQFAQIVHRSYGQPPPAPYWQQPYYQPPAPPPPRPRWGRWVAFGIGALVFICAAAVGVALVAIPILRDSSSPVAAGSQSPVPAKSPVDGDPLSVRQAWIKERIQEALAQQREALLAGDESGYLAVADLPEAEQEALLRQFHSLRAMQVAGWRDRVEAPSDRTNDMWAVEVGSTACFVSPQCADGPAKSESVWRVENGAMTMINWKPVTDESHPWQTDELIAKSGTRTVVATTKEFSGKLDELVEEADAAAIVADEFARDGKTPERYVIYFADGDDEWDRWFDWSPAEWVGGGAIFVSSDRYEIMLNSELHPSGYDDLLRHEMTHAASLPGRFRDGDKLWWLIEGIAELAEMNGAAASTYESLTEVSDLVSSNKVNDLEVGPPTSSTPDEEVSGRYGVAYLGVRCIADRYGQANLVEFFHAVVHGQKSPAAVAPEVLQIEWSVLSAECMEYIRDTAG